MSNSSPSTSSAERGGGREEVRTLLEARARRRPQRRARPRSRTEEADERDEGRRDGAVPPSTASVGRPSVDAKRMHADAASGGAHGTPAYGSSARTARGAGAGGRQRNVELAAAAPLDEARRRAPKPVVPAALVAPRLEGFRWKGGRAKPGGSAVSATVIAAATQTIGDRFARAAPPARFHLPTNDDHRCSRPHATITHAAPMDEATPADVVSIVAELARPLAHPASPRQLKPWPRGAAPGARARTAAGAARDQPALLVANTRALWKPCCWAKRAA